MTEQPHPEALPPSPGLIAARHTKAIIKEILDACPVYTDGVRIGIEPYLGVESDSSHCVTVQVPIDVDLESVRKICAHVEVTAPLEVKDLAPANPSIDW